MRLQISILTNQGKDIFANPLSDCSDLKSVHDKQPTSYRFNIEHKLKNKQQGRPGN